METAWGCSAQPPNYGPDFKWVLAAQAGYTLAFEELVARYEKRIFHLGQTILRDEADAEMLRQNTFAKVYEHLREFRGNSRFSTWVLGIAAKEALQRLREKHAGQSIFDRSAEVQSNLAVDEWAGREDNGKESFTPDDLDRFLSGGIDVLEPMSGIVFLLCDLEKCPLEEVAGFLGLPLPAVKSHLLQARHEVRRHLDCRGNRRSDPLPSYPHMEGNERFQRLGIT
jgi:RNA polymerase sigma-70 factor (ECF subfamily)